MNIRLTGKMNVYEEIAEEYKRYIELGILKNGEKLPSCRALAVELGINPNTVEKAYGYLEEMGYIRTLPKKGAYVDHLTSAESPLHKKATDTVRHFRDEGFGKEDWLSVIENVYGGTPHD